MALSRIAYYISDCLFCIYSSEVNTLSRQMLVQTYSYIANNLVSRSFARVCSIHVGY